VIAGTSTGALIAPFALLDKTDLSHVESWYTKTSSKQISAPSPAILLATALFLKWGVSLAVFGDPEARKSVQDRLIRDATRCVNGSTEIFRAQPLLYQIFYDALEEDNYRTLERCATAWTASVPKRLVACSIDFANGQPDTASNSPTDLPPRTPKKRLCDTRLFRGILASCIPPLLGPPVLLTRSRGTSETGHFDGGVHAEAPFDALLRTAAIEPAISLTHIILMSSYPKFPGDDPKPVRGKPTPFPGNPKFLDIGLRFDSLLSEANVTRDTRIARAALRLRRNGVAANEVEALTGLDIPDPVPELIEVFPKARLGWNNSDYDPTTMSRWVTDGKSVATDIFENSLP